MPDNPKKKFYLTTPIYYVNARPHIGHAYSTIAADVIARRHRLLGDDTFFLTGTDEHGQKVQRSAEKAGVPPQQFADEVSATFQNLWKRMGITNDDYIRTTDERHKRGVQKLWRDLEARGAIELREYTGTYCVSDEAFVDVAPGEPCPTCGRPTEQITEENYFFKLSEYQKKLIELIENGPSGKPPALNIQPESTRNEVLSFLVGRTFSVTYDNGNISGDLNWNARTTNDANEIAFSKGLLGRTAGGTHYLPGALKDLSISRTTFDWGIPVPSSDGVILSGAKNPRISPDAPPKPAEKHVIYVWLDALANYITAIGYGSDDPADKAKFEKYWPADLHLVGKEITRFHCVYWPAFLMAAGLPLPKSVVANGWLLFEESKMSKSRGNVVRTETILDAFGPLCPPVPNAADAIVDPTHEAVILSEAKNPRISSDAQQPLALPTKAQQDLFAADALRYFLLREIPFGQDGSFSFDALITRYNADLANGYGNLVSRVLNLLSQNHSSQIPEVFGDVLLEPSLEAAIARVTQRGVIQEPVVNESYVKATMKLTGQNVDRFFGSLDLFRLAEYLNVVIGATDAFISVKAPWKLAKQGDPLSQRQLADTLYIAAESIRIITALLYPIMPYATASVWRQLGLGDIEEAARNGELKNLQWGGLKPGTKLGPLAPIFPRADKGLAQIMTDMENPTTPAAVTEKLVSSVTAETSLLSGDPAAPTAEALNAVTPSIATPTDNLQPATPNSPLITIDDFLKIDLRVAQIVVAERIPKADKLLRLEVDLGPNFTPSRRQILSGIAEFYTPEELIGLRIAVIANLAPRKMRGLESHGMLLAASGEDHASKPILATFSDEIPLGSRIR